MTHADAMAPANQLLIERTPGSTDTSAFLKLAWPRIITASTTTGRVPFHKPSGTLNCYSLTMRISFQYAHSLRQLLARFSIANRIS